MGVMLTEVTLQVDFRCFRFSVFFFFSSVFVYISLHIVSVFGVLCSEDQYISGDRAITSNNLVTTAPAQTPQQGYAPLSAKGHKESVYALAMNDVGTILVSGGTEKVSRTLPPRFI